MDIVHRLVEKPPTHSRSLRHNKQKKDREFVPVFFVIQLLNVNLPQENSFVYGAVALGKGRQTASKSTPGSVVNCLSPAPVIVAI